MATHVQHIVNAFGVVCIEINDDTGGYVELIPDATVITLDPLSLVNLDDDAVTTLIDALTRWQRCQRLL